MLTVEHVGISLATLASIRAGLAEGFKLEDVLGAEGLYPASWPGAETRWTERLDDDPDGTLQEEYDAELARAQDRYGRRVPPLDEELRAWLDFTRRWSADPAPMALLARLELRPTDVIRLQRSWARRIAQDAALAAEANAIFECEPGDLPAITPAPSRMPPSRAEHVPMAAREPPRSTAARDEAGDRQGDAIAKTGVVRSAAVVFAALPNEQENSEGRAKSAPPEQAPQPSTSSAPAAPLPSFSAAFEVAPSPPSYIALPTVGAGVTPPLPASPSGVFGATEEVPRDLLARILQRGAVPFSAPAARAPDPAASAATGPPAAFLAAGPAGPLSGIGITGELPPDLLQRIARGPTPFAQSQVVPPSLARKPDEDSITQDAEPGHAGANEPLPFVTKQRQSSATASMPEMTTEIPRDLVERVAKGTPPFQPGPARSIDTSTGPVATDLVARIARGAVPFAGSIVGAPQQPRAPGSPRAGEDAGERMLDAPPSASKAATPFKTPTRKDRGTAAIPAIPPGDPKLPFNGSAAGIPPAPAPTVVLTLEQHAALTAELAVFHDNTAAVFAKYGLSDVRQRLAENQTWRERLRRNSHESSQWQKLYERHFARCTAQRRAGK